MFEGIDQFRQNLLAGRTCLGAGITLADSAVAEALAPSVDFLWIDLEHTHLSYETVHTHLMAARAGSAAALVRVRGSDVAHIKPIVDIGAPGIIVPQVRSAEEVRQVVAACRYPPDGTRGYGPRRPSNYGRDAGRQWMERTNRRLFVGVQIENKDALAELDAIAAVEGLDSLVLGPYDLSLALGYGAELDHAEVSDAMRRVVEAARRSGKFVGSGTGGKAEVALRAIELGVQWIQCGDDYGYMIAGVDRLLAEIRSLVGQRHFGK